MEAHETEQLRRWARLTPGIEAVIIVDANAHVEAMVAPEGRETELSSIIVMLADVADRSARALGRGELRRALAQGDLGTILARDLDGGRVLGIVAHPSVTLGVLFEDAESLASRFSSRRVSNYGA